MATCETESKSKSSVFINPTMKFIGAAYAQKVAKYCKMMFNRNTTMSHVVCDCYPAHFCIAAHCQEIFAALAAL